MRGRKAEKLTGLKVHEDGRVVEVEVYINLMVYMQERLETP
jgi:hypothetical protein